VKRWLIVYQNRYAPSGAFTVVKEQGKHHQQIVAAPLRRNPVTVRPGSPRRPRE
jgi:hypothetical protein